MGLHFAEDIDNGSGGHRMALGLRAFHTLLVLMKCMHILVIMYCSVARIAFGYNHVHIFTDGIYTFQKANINASAARVRT